VDGVITLVGVIVGLPVLGGSAIAITALIRGWSLKAREIKLREHQMRVEERLRSDEMNARILKMDDYGISPAEFSRLAEEVRQLREEVARLKQDTNGRIMG
jgi:hypothetical protein